MHVAVIGYGAVGRETAKLLLARGETVRIAQRKPPPHLPEAAEFIATDVLDADSVQRVCAGCNAVICCIGFPYDSRIWKKAWPKAMENMLAACATAQARFIFADNLYMYGPQNRPLTEDMPLTDIGRKPRVRAEITRAWQQAHDNGRVQAVALRASDFYGPDVENSVLSNFGVKRLLQGKPALIPYSPDHPHDFTYVPDFARELATLLHAPAEAYGQAWHVPNAPTQTLRSLIVKAAGTIGVAPRISVMPRAMLHLAGLFGRQAYELIEMGFQTDRPYLVDASKFARRFWANATSFEAGLEATIASYSHAN
ncbi:MAG: NAD-dependent epimerase/dehydratase family protein [Rhodomicrobium sp.]